MGKKTDTKKPAAPAKRTAKRPPAPEKIAAPEPPAPKVETPAPKAKKPAVAAAKPKAAAKPTRAAKPAKAAKSAFTHEEISLRAYFISERRQRDGIPGDPHQDWVAAQEELAAEAKAAKKKSKPKAR